jgi:tuftelin-interacting protein 11
MLDQLVLPKLQKAIASWNPRKDDVSLQTLVFPWLPLMGLRMEELVSDACRKFRSVLRAWTAPEGVPKELIKWKDVCLSTLSHGEIFSFFVSYKKVFDSAEWEEMLTK